MSVVVVLSSYREAVAESAKRAALGEALHRADLQTTHDPVAQLLWPVGAHTRDEADWVLNTVPAATELRIVTSGYHRERALLTFIKALQDRALEERVLVHVYATDESPTPPAEQEKIREYQQKGHCATYEDADAYVAYWFLRSVCTTS